VTTGRVVVVVGGDVVVVTGAEVVGVAVLGEVVDGDPLSAGGVVVIVGRVVVVVVVVVVEVEVDVCAVEGVVGDDNVGGLVDPGCSLATTMPMTPVAPAAVRAANRVSRRSRALARSLD
jgi:hypothetical protein